MDPVSRRVPFDKRKRTETSCDKCKSRKQKCDRLLNHEKCRFCELHKIECTITAPRKKRVYGVENIGNRVRLLESLVQGLLPEADVSSIDDMQQIGRSLGIQLPTVQENPTEAEQAAAATLHHDEEGTVEAIPDQQDQTQYVGPSSSFLYHLKSRKIIGNSSVAKFLMFGSNAADEVVPPGPECIDTRRFSVASQGRSGSYGPFLDCESPSDAIREIDDTIIETLMDSYFDIIHPDFPVLHEHTFRTQYESWSTSKPTADPVWLCGALCMLILARRVAPKEIPIEAEKKWWRRVQTLLPTVLFSSNIATVQALLLAALHLHNTNHRDACWNLTGAAVRVGHAIGLHRDDLRNKQTRLNREIRKQLWWTLFAFEKMQVSSYDRPSAITHVNSTVESPNERILGSANGIPPEYGRWTCKLLVILGQACKTFDSAGTGRVPPPDDAHSRPLSPTANILRDLGRWEKGLPQHLRQEVLDSLAPSSQRPVILFYAQYYYTLILVTRSALLRRAHLGIENSPTQLISAALITVAETAVDAGRSLAKVLLRLNKIDRFNAVTWFDCFFLVQAALILVLDLSIKRGKPNSCLESRTLLQSLSVLAAKQLRNPRIPGTMQALAQIVVDVNTTADQFLANASPSLQSPLSARHTESSVPVHSAGIELIDGYANDSEFWTQLSFMDQPGDMMEDFAWDDINPMLVSGTTR
jgi:hypothetical protein